MEIDTKKYQQLIADVLAKIKALDAEFIARQWLLAVLEMQHPELRIKEGLEAIKNSPAFQTKIRDKYEPLEKLLQRFGEDTLHQEVLDWFRKWTPTGPVQ